MRKSDYIWLTQAWVIKRKTLNPIQPIVEGGQPKLLYNKNLL